MKSLRYRLACVFIILIFCLAPLGAVDLDNNTKYINQDDNNVSDVSIDDVNVTVDDVNQSIETDTEKAVNDNSTDNETADLKSEYEPLEVHVDDVYVGDSAVVEIHADKDVHSVLVAWLDQWTYIEVHDGYASMKIEGLDCGNYVVDVYSDGTGQLNSTKFTVMPGRDPNLNLQVKDILGGEKAVAEVHTHDEYTGEVTLTLDDSETKTVKIENGYGKVGFDSSLNPGNHNVAAIASACHSFNASEKKASFSVSKEPYMDVEVLEAFEDEPVKIKVSTANDYNGECFWYVKDQSLSSFSMGEIVNGSYIGTSPCTFHPGTYEIEVYVCGDEKYESTDKEIIFDVKKTGKDDPNLSVDVKDIDAGDKVVAEVHADSEYTGKVTVNLKEDIKTINLKDGYGKVTFDEDLKPGDYSLQVSCEETEIFNASEKTSTFNVRRTLALDVQYRNITQGEKLEMNISTTPNYNGFILCGAGYTTINFGYFENGHYSCIFDDDNMTPGDYPLTIIAFGDGPYEQTFKSYEFTVMEK